MDKGLYDIVYQRLKNGLKMDALFATSDPKAIIAMKAIKTIGLKIPEDVSVIGFDNMEMSMYHDPPLTTISQPLYDVGARAAEKLIDMIRGKSLWNRR